jgi:hypothetical protein
VNWPRRFIAGMINLCPKLGLFSISFEAFLGLVLLQVVFACCVQDWRLLVAVACLGGRNTVSPSLTARSPVISGCCCSAAAVSKARFGLGGDPEGVAPAHRRIQATICAPARAIKKYLFKTMAC